MSGSEIARLVEFSEARAYARLVNGVTQALRDRHGLFVDRVAGAHAFVAAGLQQSLIFNRAIGLGLEEPATVETFDALDGLYRGHGVASYALELSPAATFDTGTFDLRRLGFVPVKQTTMMHCVPTVLPVNDCNLDVREVGPEAAASFADVCCEVFGFTAPYPELLRSTFEHPDWQHWLAFDANTPVAAAILAHFEDGVSWIGWVGTLPSHRGRGAQNAITAAQLRACVNRGTRRVTLEAATGSKTRPGASLRNYTRLGFTPAYNRVVYLRRLPAGSAA